MTLRLRVFVPLAGMSRRTPAPALAQEPAPFAVHAALDADWEPGVDDRQSKVDVGLPFHGIVFRNRRSGDDLSIAWLPPETGIRRSPENLVRYIV
jgi:hypothetical protein